MRRIIPLSLALCASWGCDSPKENNGRIRLQFQPVNGKPVHVDYNFSVHSVASDAVTNFYMRLDGKAESADGTITLLMKNGQIRMDGSIQGKPMNAVAGSSDSLAGDARLVAMPVFTLLDKTYKSVYDPLLNKKYEVQLEGDKIVDSTENKMQLYLRYPDHEVGVGDSWQSNIDIKAGNRMSCAAKYTLNAVKGDSAMISVQGKLSGKGESFGSEFSIDGTLKGNFTVDVATGWPIKTNVDQDFTLKLGGRELPMEYGIRSTVR